MVVKLIKYHKGSILSSYCQVLSIAATYSQPGSFLYVLCGTDNRILHHYHILLFQNAILDFQKCTVQKNQATAKTNDRRYATTGNSCVVVFSKSHKNLEL